MCVHIQWGSKYGISTQGALLEHAGELVLEDGVSERARDDGACLCPIDVEETLERAGLEYEYRRGWNEYVVSDESISAR